VFIGHFGVAMAAKKVAPRPSLGTLVLAAQLADGIWPIFLLLGWEQVAIVPGATVVTPLDFTSYPYTHSLVASCAWAALLSAAYYALRHDIRGAACLGALVVSHWVLDVVAHRPDLPLWPDGPRFGLGLWYSLPATLAVEFALFGIGAGIYASVTRPLDRWGSALFWAFLIVVVAVYFAAVLGPPPPSVRMLALSGLLGWLFVAWGYWIDRHRAPVQPARGFA
jgi:hypothetical protein